MTVTVVVVQVKGITNLLNFQMVVVTFLAAYLIRSKFHIIDTAEEYKKCDFFYDENEYYGKIACGCEWRINLSGYHPHIS